MFLSLLQDGVALDGSLIVRVVVARRALPELREHGGAAAQLCRPGRHCAEDQRTEDLVTDQPQGRVVLLVSAVAEGPAVVVVAQHRPVEVGRAARDAGEARAQAARLTGLGGGEGRGGPENNGQLSVISLYISSFTSGPESPAGT